MLVAIVTNSVFIRLSFMDLMMKAFVLFTSFSYGAFNIGHFRLPESVLDFLNINTTGEPVRSLLTLLSKDQLSSRSNRLFGNITFDNT